MDLRKPRLAQTSLNKPLKVATRVCEVVVMILTEVAAKVHLCPNKIGIQPTTYVCRFDQTCLSLAFKPVAPLVANLDLPPPLSS
jgi:hypothetical protein